MAPARFVCRKVGGAIDGKIRRKFPAPEKPPVRAMSSINGSQRIESEPNRDPTIATLIDDAALTTPLLIGRASFRREQLRLTQALCVREEICVRAHEHHMRRPLHHAPRNRDGMQMAPESGDAPALRRREHHATIETHATRRVRKAPITHAIDVTRGICVRACRFHCVERSDRTHRWRDNFLPCGFIRAKTKRPSADDAHARIVACERVRREPLASTDRFSIHPTWSPRTRAARRSRNFGASVRATRIHRARPPHASDF